MRRQKNPKNTTAQVRQHSALNGQRYFVINTAYSISEPLQSNTNIISWHIKLSQSFSKGKSWKWRNPTLFFCETYVPFPAPQFLSWPHFKKASLHSPAERCQGRSHSPMRAGKPGAVFWLTRAVIWVRLTWARMKSDNPRSGLGPERVTRVRHRPVKRQ